jgi:hypothetical protein
VEIIGTLVASIYQRPEGDKQVGLLSAARPHTMTHLPLTHSPEPAAKAAGFCLLLATMAQFQAI